MIQIYLYGNINCNYEKTKNTFKKGRSVLSVLILLQSCSLYLTRSKTLYEASQSNTKVRVWTKTNENLKFKRIELQDGQYYGVKKIKGDLTRVYLDKTKINDVRLRNKAVSTIFTSILVLSGVIVVFAFGVWIGDN